MKYPEYNRRLGVLPAALLAAVGFSGYFVDAAEAFRFGMLFFAACVLVMFMIDRLPEFERFVTAVIDSKVRRLREISFMDKDQLEYAIFENVAMEIVDDGYTITANNRTIGHKWIIHYLRQGRGSEKLPALNRHENKTTIQEQEKALIYWMTSRRWVIAVSGDEYRWVVGMDASKAIEIFEIIAGERWME